MRETVKQRNAVVNGRHRSLIIGFLLFLALLVACALYARLITAPMASFDLSPSSVPERWTLQLPDGSALTANDGKIPVSTDNSVLICRLRITEKLDDMPEISVSANNADCVFYLDGQLIYSPSGRYREGQFSDDPYERGSASGQFSLRNLKKGSELTMIAQLQGEENRLSRLPKITFYPGRLMYLSQYTAPVSENAMAAGIYFTIAVAVTGLYLIGLWRGKKDANMILTAICSLSMAFSHTNAFSHQATNLFYSPTFVWFFSGLPQLMMIWILWFMLSPKLRLRTVFLPGGITGYIVAISIAGFSNRAWNTRMNAVTAWFLPGVFFLMLVVTAAEAIRSHGKSRSFYRCAVRTAPIVVLAAAFSAVIDGKLASAISSAWSRALAPDHSFYQLCSLICTLFLLICFIRALLELIEGLSRQDAELRTISLREKCAIENMTILRRSQEETRRYQHEMQHHMIVLDELISRNQDEKASAYIHHLLEESASVPQGVYSENLVINAVAGYYLNEAKADGIRVENQIRTTDQLPLTDEELCVMLSNLLENALEACRSMNRNSDRYISVTLSASPEHMTILCENSTDSDIQMDSDGSVVSSKADMRNHGYGLASVRQIVDRHYGLMTLACQEGHFKAELSI